MKLPAVLGVSAALLTLLAVGAAVYAADAALKDRTSSGVQKPTAALLQSHGKTPKNTGGPAVLAECVKNYDEPDPAKWTLEQTAFALSPDWRLRPGPADGFCWVEWRSGAESPSILLRGNLRDVAARFVVASDGDLVAILFDAK